MNQDQQWKALVRLRRIMSERLSSGELRDLCFDMQVDFEVLPGEGKSDKVRELLSFLARRKRIPQLVAVGSELRPDIPWPAVDEVVTDKGDDQAETMVLRLQGTRAELLSDVYAQIVDLAEDLRIWAYQDMPVGLAPAEVDEKEIIAQLRQLTRQAGKAMIFLGSETRKQLKRVLEELVVTQQALERRAVAPDEEASWEAHVAALDRLFDTIPPAIEGLEGEIRQLLGVG